MFRVVEGCGALMMLRFSVQPVLCCTVYWLQNFVR